MDNEEIQGMKFSEFQSATPDNADEVVGLHSGNNVRFSVANFVLAIRQGLTNLFVPTSRTVNSKALSSDITLDASDVGAYELPSGGIPKSDLAQSVQDSLDDADSAYQLPSGGIPDSDLASAVQTSLGLADTAYQLPSGGIPSSDMASAVQTSLGKADTAYQKPSGGIPASDLASGVIPTVPSISTSTPQMDGTGAAGSTGEVSDAGHTHPTDTSRVPVYGLGKNLLDNAYFIGGGSQLGAGILPINQRGQSQYTTAGYIIDRWSNTRNNTITLESDGLKLTYSTGQGYQQLSQTIDNYQKLKGITVTFSALLENTSPCYLRMVYGSGTDDNILSDQIPANSSGLFKVTGTIPTGATSLAIQISSNALTPTSGYFKVKAAKLEIGTEQTLAHLEGSTWVLNEIPDYGEELRKCQRYLWILHANNDNYMLALGATVNQTDSDFVIPLPVTMRQNKVLTISSEVISDTLPRVYNNATNTNLNTASILSAGVIGNILAIAFKHNSTTAGATTRLLLMSGCKLGISLEI